jgi:hypothetical protein
VWVGNVCGREPYGNALLARGRLLGAVAAFALGFLGVSCGNNAAQDAALEPLTTSTPRAPHSPEALADADADPGQPADPRLAVLEALLERHDRARTALAAEPGAASDPQSAVVRRWHRVVEEGSILDDYVRSATLTDLEANRMVVRPRTTGAFAGPTSWVTHVVEVEPAGEDPNLVSFRYCGYSPGIGYHIGTGAVLDDRRSHSRGRGVAEIAGDGNARLTELGDDDIRILGPGEADPC